MDKKSARLIFGVLGFPVRHSLSPFMHNAAFQALKINAEYRFFEKQPRELEKFLRSLPKENIRGLNVTVPYKEKTVPFLDNLSKEARLIGAVNTIKVNQNKLDGFNTDGEGFLKHLKEDLKFTPQGKAVMIIGAGGAARAITIYLSEAKVKSIAIYDIEKEKAFTLVGHLRKNFANIDFQVADSISGLNLEGCDLLVNATPVGMKEQDPCLVDEKILQKNLLVYDLIYNPAQTKLLKIARAKGCRVSNGLGMLLYQGAISFEIWTGQKAPVEVMRKALMEGLKR